jgi:Tol biopolymer transport system component
MHIDEQMDIVTMDVRGGQPLRLTTNPSADWFTSWSRDGRWVYFCSNRTGRVEVWKAPSGGGKPIQVTTEGGSRAVESPDGKYLYYPNEFRRVAELWRMPTSGGPPEKVLDGIHSVGCAVTETGIYFVPPPEAEKGALVIKYHEFKTGSEKTVVRLVGVSPTRGVPAVSPDGRFLLFVGENQQGSDLMLVENFR